MKRIFTLGIILISLTACKVDKINQDTKTKVDNIKHGIKITRELKSDLKQMSGSAVSLAIYHKGNIVYEKAIGTHQHGTHSKVNKNTLFQVGSVNKMFTALAISQLIEQNIIQPDTLLTDALPEITLANEVKDGWNEISIHHLLSNQTGLMDIVDWEPLPMSLMQATTDYYPQTFGQMNPAGAFYNYSNSNWSYLGAVLEHQSGTTYQSLMKSQVFNRLGMTSTTMDTGAVHASGNFALSGNKQTVTLENIPKPVFGLPAGGYTWSTPSELLKMAKFLIHGAPDILSNQQRKEMISPQINERFDIPSYYGYGITITDGLIKDGKWLPTKVWTHDGQTLDYKSELWILPEHDFALAVVTNSTDLNIEKTFNKALELYLTLPALEPLTIPMPTETDFKLFSGEYQTPYGPAFITYVDSGLEIDVPGLEAANISYSNKLQTLSKHVYLLEIDGVTTPITFLIDDKTDQVLIRNRSFVAQKVN